MEVKLFAAVVAALAAGGVYAQPSMILYDMVDAGLIYANKVPNGNSGGSSHVGLDSDGLSDSRRGLRGVKDLGGGLKGIFNLGSGSAIGDNKSAQGGRLFGRSAYVGLQGQWDQLTLGRQQNLLYDFSLIYDPMAIASCYDLANQDAFFSSRADNVVKYIGTFGGLSVSALYSFNRDGSEQPGLPRLGRKWGLGANYAGGPFSVGAVYDQSNQMIIAMADSKGQRATIVDTYAFGPARLYTGYRWCHTNFTAVAGNGNLRSNLYWLDAGYQATSALMLTGMAYYQQFKNSSVGNPWLLVVGTNYVLSRRTNAYFNLAYAKNSSGSGLGVFNLNMTDSYAGTALSSINFGSKSVYSSPAVGNANQFSAAIGIRHRF